MSITKNQRSSHFAEARRCPSCNRGMALVLNPYYGVRYCRWAEQGLCDNSEATAVADREQRRGKRTVGGYESSGRPATDLRQPPAGPAPGARTKDDHDS
jgi:hypothetical protein